MVRGDIAVEENLNKHLYRAVLYLTKTIPVIISGIYLVNTVLSYMYIDIAALSYIVQFLFILYMYITSFAFKFCKWHRMFIHYILVILILNIIDYHIGIPVSDKGLFLLYIILTSAFLFTIIYYKTKA